MGESNEELMKEFYGVLAIKKQGEFIFLNPKEVMKLIEGDKVGQTNNSNLQPKK